MTTRKLLTQGLSLLTVVVWTSLSGLAQFTSAIEGTVSDPSGALVPGASVTLKNLQTGISQSVQSSGTGYYRFTSLPVALFNITVAAPGFKTLVQENIRTEVAETRTVNVKLELGNPTSELTVTATPAPVESSEGRVSGFIDQREVRDLPMVGRNFFSLVVLTPGVTGLPSGGGQLYAQATADIFNPEFGVNLNASGLRSESNRLLVDSADVTSYITRGVTNFSPTGEAVQEMRVEVTNFSAMYPGAAGAVVNVITKQGTNDWHGTASWYHTDNVLNSRTVFQSTLPVFRRNEAAWGLGGPIWKDHTFVFGSMDILKSGVGTAFPAVVATPQFIDFMDQNHPDNISTYLWETFKPAVTPTRNFTTAGSMTGTDCSTLASPSDLISSPVGNIACNLPVTGEGDFNQTVGRNGFQWNVRVDQMLNHDKDRLYGSIFRTSRHTVLFATPTVYPDLTALEADYHLFFNVNETHSFSPTVINQIGLSYSRPTGAPVAFNSRVPGINVIGMAGMGNGFGPGLYVQNNYEWRDVLSFNRGSHSFKAGTGMQTGSSVTLGFAPIWTRPVYSFLSVFDFANDSPYFQTQQIIDPRTGEFKGAGDDDRNHMWSAFIQDDWKARPNLTFNLGLRWEDMGNFREKECANTTGIVFQGGSDFFSRIANAKMDIVCPMLPHDLINNWAPRFGFAWDPTKQGKMSIRGGLGIFYDKISKGTPLDNTPRNPPVAASVSGSIYTPPVLPVYALGKSDTPPFGFPLPANLVLGLDAKNGLLSGPVYVGVMDPHLRPAYSENWFLGVQYSFASNWVLEADHIGSAGHRAYVAYDANRFAGDLIQNNGVLTRLNHSFGQIQYADASTNSFYSGGTVAVRNRTTHGLTMQAAYTVGKAIDAASVSRNFGIKSSSPFPVVTNLRIVRGLSDYDVRQKLAISLDWGLPRPKFGSGYLNNALGGWHVAGVTILQSGSPFPLYCSTPFIPVRDASGAIIGDSGCDYNADGMNYDVPMTPAFGNSKHVGSRSEYLTGMFKASDFPAPPFGQEGNLGRNTFIGPGYANTDLSIFKDTHIPWLVREGAYLQVRAEFFNAFNRVNLAPVEGDLGSPQFGESTGTYPARNVQLSLRLTF
jgi:hypothetical protein